MTSKSPSSRLCFLPLLSQCIVEGHHHHHHHHHTFPTDPPFPDRTNLLWFTPLPEPRVLPGLFSTLFTFCRTCFSFSLLSISPSTLLVHTYFSYYLFWKCLEQTACIMHHYPLALLCEFPKNKYIFLYNCQIILKVRKFILNLIWASILYRHILHVISPNNVLWSNCFSNVYLHLKSFAALGCHSL